MTDWAVPEGLAGNAGLLRVQAGDAQGDSWSCPQFLAAKVRPGLWPTQRSPRERAGLTQFQLDPAMVLLDLIERDHMTLDRALSRLSAGKTKVRPQGGLLRWAEHATGQYLAAGTALDADREADVAPYLGSWVVQLDRADGNRYELCAWGRRYHSADGQVRELRIPRAGSVGTRPVDRGLAAAAALVLGWGWNASLWPESFGAAYSVEKPQPVHRARVVEVGCEDGSWQVLFDGSPDEAKKQYDEHARGPLAAARAGGEYRPGLDCVKCKLRDTCPALLTRPGLLGVAAPGQPVLSWSVTSGRHYLDCPAQEYLERLHLPRAGGLEPTGAIRRGQAVHAWLAERHARRPVTPCEPEDVPGSPDAWAADGWAVTGADARLGAQLIGDHAVTCALQGLPPGAAVLPEQQLVVYDPEARILIMVKADLLYGTDGAWTLREAKTAGTVSQDHLLGRYPQLALAVLLLAAGIPAGEARRNRVELERLTPVGPLLDVLHPADPDLQAEARRVIGAMVAPWRADHSADPVPGRACAGCEVIRWCPDADASARPEEHDEQ
jgi:hypothetical protein